MHNSKSYQLWFEQNTMNLEFAWTSYSSSCVCGERSSPGFENSFFSVNWTRHSSSQDGYNLVYQERGDGQGHVLIQKYQGGINIGYKGTGDYTQWLVQEYYY